MRSKLNIYKILIAVLLCFPIVVFSQENQQVSNYLKKINLEYLFPNKELTLGKFDAEFLNPAIESITPFALKEQKYTAIEIETKFIFEDSMLTVLAKHNNVSIDSLKKNISKSQNIYIYSTMGLGNSIYDGIQFEINQKEDTIITLWADKQNHKITYINSMSIQDTFVHFYDDKSRLIKKIDKRLMEGHNGRKSQKTLQFYRREDFYFSYTANTIQAVKYKKDTMILRELLTKREYEKLQKEPLKPNKNFYIYYLKNGKKYDEYYVKESFDTTLITLNEQFKPIERVKYLQDFNRKIEVAKYLYNEKEQIVLEDKKLYGSNDVEGVYIDSSKIIFNYDNNGFLSEKKYLNYQHYGNPPSEASTFYIYKIKMEDDLLHIKKSSQRKNGSNTVFQKSDEYTEYWINQGGEIVKVKSKSLLFPFLVEQKLKYHLR